MSEPRLQGITEPDYQVWRHHPVTKLVLQYMADFREALRRDALARWESGALTLTDEHELRARSNVLAELGELQFPSIANFYGEDTKEEFDAA